MSDASELLKAALYAYKNEGNKQRAISVAQQVMANFPRSAEASKAEVLISRLSGQAIHATNTNVNPAVGPREVSFEYKFVQIPSSIDVSAGGGKGTEAAAFLQSIVDEYVESEWEFYRVDSYGTNVKPGCLGMLLGMKADYVHHYVVSFRRPRRR